MGRGGGANPNQPPSFTVFAGLVCQFVGRLDFAGLFWVPGAPDRKKRRNGLGCACPSSFFVPSTGPPDLTVPGFGVPIGSAYLSARRTFGRPKVRLRGHRQGGTHTRRNTQKAVCGHRRSHVIKGATGKAVHTEGGTHKRRNTQKAAYSHRRSHVI